MDVKMLWRYGHGVFLTVFLIDWVILNFTVLYSQLFPVPCIRPKLYWTSLKMLSCTHLCFRNTTIAIVNVISKIYQWKVAADYKFLGTIPTDLMWKDGHTHIHACTYIHAHMCSHTCTYIYIYRHKCIHTHTHAHLYSHIHACTHALWHNNLH